MTLHEKIKLINKSAVYGKHILRKYFSFFR